MDETGNRGIKTGAKTTEVGLRRILRRRALLIGVAEYESSEAFDPLKYPVRDVRALGSLLLEYGYTSVQCMDDDVADPRMRPLRANVLREIAELCAQAKEDDLVWVHFSGHGLRLPDGSGREVRLLVTKDTRGAEPQTTGLQVDRDIIEPLRACRARQKILSLDACHVGLVRSSDAQPMDDLAYDLGAGLAVLAASTSRQYAQEASSEQHGIFTAFLMKVMQREVAQNKFAELTRVSAGVLAEVMEWYKRHNRLPQQPNHHFEGMGHLLLADCRVSASNGGAEIPSHLDPACLRMPDYLIHTSLGGSAIYGVYQASTGKGGSGAQSEVILTVLSKDFTDRPQNSQVKQLFGRSQAALDQLNKPGSPDVGIPKQRGKDLTASGLLFLITDFVVGTKLDTHKDKGIDLNTMIRWGFSLACTLYAAHSRNMVHGDLNPDFIIIESESLRPFVVNFAVSSADAKIRLMQGAATGRSLYWPPEFKTPGDSPTESGDIYALGVILKELLPVPRPQESLPEIPDALHKLLARMTSEQPSARPVLGEICYALSKLSHQPLPAWIKFPPDSGPRRHRRAMRTAAVTSALLVGGGGYYLWKHPPTPPPIIDGGTVARTDFRAALGPVDENQVLRERARKILSEGLTARGPYAAHKAVIQHVARLRDPEFAPLLRKILSDPSLSDSVRAEAARALGRLGAVSSAADLEQLIRSPNTELSVFRECLYALCALTSEQQVLRGAASAYLKKGADEERREAAAILLAASAPQVRELLQPRYRAAIGRSAGNADLLVKESTLLLALTRAQQRGASDLIAGLLKFSTRPSGSQVRLAVSLGSAGDRSGVRVLRAFLKDLPADEQQAETAQNARLILARIDPDPEMCAGAEQQLREPAAALDTLLITIEGLAGCRDATRFLTGLKRLLLEQDPESPRDPVLAATAAATALEILAGLEVASRLRSARGRERLDPAEWAVRSAEASQLVALYEHYMQLAADPGNSMALRRSAAKQGQVARQELAERQRSEGTNRGLPEQAVALEKRLQAGKGAKEADQRLLWAMSSTDEVALRAALTNEPDPLVRQALAEGIKGPEAEVALRQSAASSGSGSELSAVRALGELYRRSLLARDTVQRPPDMLLTLYREGSADQRLELIEALRGWPLPITYQILALATGDGSVQVRRSVVRRIAEATAEEGTRIKALGLLRLLFGDPDWVVQLTIRGILGINEVPRSEAGPAPDWPIQLEEPSKSCAAKIVGDDEGAVVKLDGKDHKLPLITELKPGRSTVTYADDNDSPKRADVHCSGGKPVSLLLPTSRLGQLLNQGIGLFKGGDLRGSQDLFVEVQAQGGSSAARASGPSRLRLQKIVALSYYYSGLIHNQRNQSLAAFEKLEKFLGNPASAGLEQQVADARTQVNKLKSTKLGCFIVRLKINGECKTETKWFEISQTKATISIAGRIFRNQTIHLGNPPTEGPHECP